jgi:hypothetical protein
MWYSIILFLLISEIIQDLIKNCEFTTVERDFVIIKQGDKGDW